MLEERSVRTMLLVLHVALLGWVEVVTLLILHVILTSIATYLLCNRGWRYMV